MCRHQQARQKNKMFINTKDKYKGQLQLQEIQPRDPQAARHQGILARLCKANIATVTSPFSKSF